MDLSQFPSEMLATIPSLVGKNWEKWLCGALGIFETWWLSAALSSE